MKTCIYGAGAIGGFIGARLAAQGHAVSAVARGATLEAINAHGMRLRSGGTEIAPRIVASSDPHTLGVQDLVVVAVKEPAMREVAPRIAPLIGPDTVVLTAMNGVQWWFFHGMPGPCAGMTLETLDRDGAIGRAIPASHVVGCVVHASCKLPEPGVVQHVMGQGLIIGEPGGGTSIRVSLKPGTDAAGFQRKCAKEILEGLEVAPGRVDVHTGKEMLEFLGMETEMKEKRFIDTRPK